MGRVFSLEKYDRFSFANTKMGEIHRSDNFISSKKHSLSFC